MKRVKSVRSIVASLLLGTVATVLPGATASAGNLPPGMSDSGSQTSNPIDPVHYCDTNNQVEAMTTLSWDTSIAKYYGVKKASINWGDGTPAVTADIQPAVQGSAYVVPLHAKPHHFLKAGLYSGAFNWEVPVLYLTSYHGSTPVWVQIEACQAILGASVTPGGVDATFDVNLKKAAGSLTLNAKNVATGVTTSKKVTSLMPSSHWSAKLPGLAPGTQYSFSVTVQDPVTGKSLNKVIGTYPTLDRWVDIKITKIDMIDDSDAVTAGEWLFHVGMQADKFSWGYHIKTPFSSGTSEVSTTGSGVLTTVIGKANSSNPITITAWGVDDDRFSWYIGDEAPNEMWECTTFSDNMHRYQGTFMGCKDWGDWDVGSVQVPSSKPTSFSVHSSDGRFVVHGRTEIRYS